MPRRAALSKIAGPGSRPSQAGARRGAVRWVAGLLLSAGFVLGAGLFTIMDAAESGHEQPRHLGAGLTDGCTALALDRDNGRTEARPCPELAPQEAANFQAPLLPPTAY